MRYWTLEDILQCKDEITEFLYAFVLAKSVLFSLCSGIFVCAGYVYVSHVEAREPFKNTLNNYIYITTCS